MPITNVPFLGPTLQKLRSHLRRPTSLIQERYLRGAGKNTIVMDVAKFPYMGFGATISWVHMAYVACDALGAQLQVINSDQWPFGGKRAECALSRFIHLPTESLGADLVGNRFVNFDPGNQVNLERWGYYDELHWKTSLFGYKPASFSSLELYRRSILARAYVPTDFSKAVVNKRLNFLPESYVAWHIRRGDKTSGPAKEDDAVSVAQYANATEQLLLDAPRPPRHIVISTDSDQALEEAMAIAPKIGLGMTVVFDDDEKRWDGYCALHRAGKINDVETMVTEVLTAQKIIEIFRRANYLVGCNSSYLFRVGSMLQISDQTAVSLSENKSFKKYYPI